MPNIPPFVRDNVALAVVIMMGVAIVVLPPIGELIGRNEVWAEAVRAGHAEKGPDGEYRWLPVSIPTKPSAEKPHDHGE